MDTETDNHSENSTADRPWLWKKGQSGNLKGRPKGKTMKEWAREYLSKMTDEERDEWMSGLDKHVVWKMAEGNPETKTDVTSGGEKIVFLPPDVIDRVNNTSSETK